MAARRDPNKLQPVPAALVAAVVDGAFETPLWSTFLTELRNLTGADYATLIFRPPDRPLTESLHLFSGDDSRLRVDDVYSTHLSSLELLTDFRAEPGPVYSFGDLYPPKSSRHRVFYEEVVVPSGISALRMIRVNETAGVSAWLTISRRSVDFTTGDDDLLRSIAPVLRGVLRNYVALERERFAAAVTGDAMRRLHFGWMTLDARGHVLEHEREAGRVLTLSGVLSKGPQGRLVVRGKELKQEIFKGIERLAGNAQARPLAITLCQDPWLDMLLIPSAQSRLSANPRAAVIAYVHGDSWHSADRCEQLRQLFGLSPSEARLALALTRGMTISEAAVELGIQVGTARKCSKQIYAKSGARGLPDLVRIMMRSVLALAPER